MPKKNDSFYLLRWCLLLLCCNSFSQTQIWKSDFAFNDFKSDGITGSMIISDSSFLLDAPNDTKKIEAAKTSQEKYKNKK